VVVQQLDGKIEQSANEVASRVTDENGLMDAKLDQVTGRVNVALEVGSSANWRVPGIGWGVSLVRSRLLFVGCRHAGHRPQTRDVGARYPGVRAASRQRQSTASQGIGGLDQRAGAATNCHVSPTSSLRADVGVFAAQIRPMHGGRELIILRVRAWAAGAVRETQLKSGEIGMVELRTELVGLRRQLAMGRTGGGGGMKRGSAAGLPVITMHSAAGVSILRVWPRDNVQSVCVCRSVCWKWGVCIANHRHPRTSPPAVTSTAGPKNSCPASMRTV
jgi:hypothetical protein